MSEALLIAVLSPAGDHGSTAEHAKKPSEMPSLRDPRSFVMTAILVLLVLVILYFTGEVVLPIIFAFLLNLLLQPAMEALISGALLAMPLLASFKIICDRIRPLMALGHFVGGEGPRLWAGAPPIPALGARPVNPSE
jgi:hypothetical protein